MRIALFFDKQLRGTVGQYFERGFQEVGLTCDHFWTQHAHAGLTNYDLYIRIDHGDYRYDLPPSLRPAVFMAIDTHLPKSLRHIQRQARHYDWVCCAQQDAVPRLPHASWLPLGCDPATHGGVGQAAQFDVAYIGTDGGVPRKFFLQELRERYPNSHVGHAWHTDIGRIYSASRVVFNYAIRNDINMRVFEAMCAGSCLLTNAIHDNGWETLFRDREHVVAYRSPKECWSLLEYYLQHEEERLRIARNGQALVMTEHTYAHRVRALLEEIRTRLMPIYPQLAELAAWTQLVRMPVATHAVIPQ